MEISAQVQNGNGRHHVALTTNGATHAIQIPPKPNGLGSAANGGEILLLALATCYCNDIYREAEARGIEVEQVEIEVDADFPAPSEPAANVRYRAKV